MTKSADRLLKLQLRIYLSLLFIPLIAACLVLYIFYGFVSISAVIISLFSAIFLICFFKLIPDYWKNYSYSDGIKSLSINRGIFFKRTIVITSDCVQYIFISKSLIQRTLGICTLNLVMGAGTERLWAIKSEEAEKIRIKMER